MNALADSLHAARDFLGRHGEGRWAGVLGAALARHGDDAPALARAVLAACDAGLGRAVLSPRAGHGVQVCAIDGTNRALARLRAQLRAEAEAVLAG